MDLENLQPHDAVDEFLFKRAREVGSTNYPGLVLATVKAGLDATDRPEVMRGPLNKAIADLALSFLARDFPGVSEAEFTGDCAECVRLIEQLTPEEIQAAENRALDRQAA